MKQNSLPVGTRVERINGIRLTGTIIKPFYWREATDGTYKAPARHYLPVEWDDKTKGFEPEHYLRKIES
jgi:hypothetical protein